MTDRYAVIGNPIAHSKSPLIHQMFAQQTGQDMCYEAILSPTDGFSATIARLRHEGYKGCSITVPFKFEAFQIATQLTERAQAAHAVNTLKFEGDTILGENTDGAGLVGDIEHNLDFSLTHKKVLLLGAGGAAYGAALPLLQAGIAQLSIANRTPEKAQRLAASLAQKFGNVSVCDFSANHSADLIINATSSSLSNASPVLPVGVFSSGSLAYEMMYGHETPFMTFARHHGAAIISDGLGMLIEQAAEAFFLWRGVRPDTLPVFTALRS